MRSTPFVSRRDARRGGGVEVECGSGAFVGCLGPAQVFGQFPHGLDHRGGHRVDGVILGQVQQQSKAGGTSTRVPMALRPPGPRIKSPAVRLLSAQESRVWLRSPCAVVANWECPLGSPGCLGC